MLQTVLQQESNDTSSAELKRYAEELEQMARLEQREIHKADRNVWSSKGTFFLKGIPFKQKPKWWKILAMFGFFLLEHTCKGTLFGALLWTDVPDWRKPAAEYFSEGSFGAKEGNCHRHPEAKEGRGRTSLKNPSIFHVLSKSKVKAPPVAWPGAFTQTGSTAKRLPEDEPALLCSKAQGMSFSKFLETSYIIVWPYDL